MYITKGNTSQDVWQMTLH